MEEFIAGILRQHGWIAWILLGAMIALIVYAFAQGREIDLKIVRIGPRRIFEPNLWMTASNI